MPLKLGVLASGRGSNFEALQESIEAGAVPAVIKVVIADKPQAPVLEKAAARGIESCYINPGQFAGRQAYEQELARVCVEYGVELVVLAGYMGILGDTFINKFPLRVINIHPALLPSFSGLHAHRQAIEYGVRFSGCTVHFVDLGVDTGPIILQQTVPVLPEDDEDSLAERILREEHILLPQAVKLIAQGRVAVEGRRVTILAEEEN
ncbi:MAG: phosphoribosylglycinamide formyltransferase [Syntrophomonadaceae bacterium]|nr:phosphoribosylglycinamide formyltransferase [Syntrophomonadaceae bacterium]